jgi:hypothetical protein
MNMKLWIAGVVLAVSGVAMAQHGAEAQRHAATPMVHEGHGEEADNAPHPALPHDADWTWPTVLVILFMFAGAMIIGPIVRASTPEEVPPAHSHDEPPGTSGHHGHSGTIDIHPPEEKHGHGHGH